jgi:PadR family transcriptional regulator, regulatory protein PadR
MDAGVNTMARRIEKDFFSGSIRLQILRHADRGPVFGAGLIDELQRDGYSVSPGTLYPILHGLERGGYLKAREHIVHGKRRRSYIVTPKGQSALRLSRPRIVSLLRGLIENGRLERTGAKQRPVRANSPQSSSQGPPRRLASTKREATAK